jgi:ribonuclease Z
MKIYLKVLGTETGDSSPSLVLHIETTLGTQRILINCGEGLQRLATQHKIKLVRFNNILLTRLKWEHIGGLPGAMLTLGDAGMTNIHVHGPLNTGSFLEAMRYFFKRHDMHLEATEFVSEDAVEIGKVFVKPIILSAHRNSNSDIYHKNLSDEEKLLQCQYVESSTIITTNHNHQMVLCPKLLEQERLNKVHRKIRRAETDNDMLVEGNTSLNNDTQMDINNVWCQDKNLVTSNDNVEIEIELPKMPDPNVRSPLQRKLFPKAYHRPVENCLSSLESDMSVCYVITTPDIPGKFDAKKAKALGVESGPMFGLLVKGESVLAKNGSTIHPHDVISPQIPGEVILVVHCVTALHVSILVSHPHFIDYFEGKPDASRMLIIIHMTPQSLIELTEYSEWMSKFKKDVQHLFINEQCQKEIIFTSWTLNQHRINNIHPRLFPIPYSSIHEVPSKLQHQFNITIASSLMEYHVLPVNIRGYNKKCLIKKIEENDIWEGIPIALQAKIQQKNKEICQESEIVSRDPNAVEVVFLGTGSAVPSKYRNVTSNFVNVPNYGTILLDAGEGSYGQLYRRFGPELLNQHLINLKLVFISHIHGDHHLGLLRILTKRKELLPNDAEKLVIICPSTVQFWLSEFSEFEALGNYLTFDNFDLINPSEERAIFFNSLLGLTQCQTVYVDHCFDAYGIVISHLDGWKIVFSGDTRPCPQLAKIGANATLVIHEATFEDDKKRDALEKFHSTTGEAITISKLMNAQYVMLNHFSQRYPKMPYFNEEYVDYAGVAFDLMSFTFADFVAISKLYYLLKEIFQIVTQNEENEKDIDDEEYNGSATKNKNKKTNINNINNNNKSSNNKNKVTKNEIPSAVRENQDCEITKKRKKS